MQRLSAVLAATILLSACRSSSPGTQSAGAQPASGGWIARFATSGLNLQGDARLSPLDSRRYRVRIELRQVNPTARLPWAVWSGRCGETNAQLLTVAVPSIDGRADRTATMQADVPVDLEPGRDYHITLGASLQQSQDIIACGALTYVP